MALPKIAIVTDWLTNMGGAERVVLAAHEAFPNAPIYTSVYTAETMPDFEIVIERACERSCACTLATIRIR